MPVKIVYQKKHNPSNNRQHQSKTLFEEYEHPEVEPILNLLYQFGLLDARQITTLLDTKSFATIKRRLLQMRQSGLIDWLHIPLTNNIVGGAPRAFYILAPAGKNRLRKKGTTDFRGLPKKSLSTLFLKHTLAINRVRIAVTMAANKRGWQVIKWVGENKIKSEYGKIKTPGDDQPATILPDSYFVIQEPNKPPSHFFLELDRGTMTNKRFQGKVTAYVRYKKTGEYLAHYHTDSLKVLTVVDTPTTGRLQNLRQTTQAVKRCGRMFWFAHLPAITSRDPLIDPIWQVANDKAPIPLFH
jgi:hypothetical protein